MDSNDGDEPGESHLNSWYRLEAVLIKWGYSVSEVKSFTLGELVCRGDAVVLHTLIDAINQRILLLDTAMMELKDKVDARRAMQLEINRLNHNYNYLVVE